MEWKISYESNQAETGWWWWALHWLDTSPTVRWRRVCVRMKPRERDVRLRSLSKTWILLYIFIKVYFYACAIIKCMGHGESSALMVWCYCCGDTLCLYQYDSILSPACHILCLIYLLDIYVGAGGGVSALLEWLLFDDAIDFCVHAGCCCFFSYWT